MTLFRNPTNRTLFIHLVFLSIIFSYLFVILGYFLRYPALLGLCVAIGLSFTLFAYVMGMTIDTNMKEAWNSKSKHLILNPTEGPPKIVYQDNLSLDRNSFKTISFQLADMSSGFFDLTTGIVMDAKRTDPPQYVRLATSDYMSPNKDSNIVPVLGTFKNNSDPNVLEVDLDTTRLEEERKILMLQIKSLKRENENLRILKEEEQNKRFAVELNELSRAGQYFNPLIKILGQSNPVTGEFSGTNQDLESMRIRSKAAASMGKKQFFELIKKEADSQLDKITKKERD